MSKDGYILDLDYIYGYFAEQSPTRLRLSLLSRGVANQVSSKSSYLELGFGQGLTLAINAATSDGIYYGTDFNPSQAASARCLAEATGKSIALFDQSFEELAARTDLPEFDIISLHGIWSWVSDESRAAIVEIAKNKLKPGGIFYVSYNTNPGWSPATPMRHLLSEYAKRVATGPLLSKVDQSLAFVESVIDAGAKYFIDNPGLAERIKRMRQSDKTYVSHEYFNQNWHPMSFIEISEMLSEAKLSFAASANLVDNLESLSVPSQAMAILNGIADENLRQMTKDFFIGQQFRRDIFQKGVRQMSKGEMRQEINNQKFVLTGDGSMPPRSIFTSAGEANLLPEIYDPICKVFIDSTKKPIGIADISKALSGKSIDDWQIWEALLVLSASAWISPRSSAADNPISIWSTQLLNNEILKRSKYSESIQCLAITETGTSLQVSRIEQMLIYYYLEGEENPADEVLRSLGLENEKILNNGEAVEDDAVALSVLREIWEKLKEGKLQYLLDSFSIVKPQLELADSIQEYDNS